MKWIKRIFKVLLGLLLLIVFYFTVAIVCTYISVNEKPVEDSESKIIYLSTNGVHLDIVIPTSLLSQELAKGIISNSNTQFCSFGWQQIIFLYL